MAIYHFSVQIFQRSAGRSAFAGAMYRAGERGTCIYDGREHNYTEKGWVTHTEILLPDHIAKTHPEFYDRCELWNTIEWSEKSPKAQLAREVELSLPVELTSNQQRGLLRNFVQKTFVNQGMIADICIHNPPVKDDLGRPLDAAGNPTNDTTKMQFCNPHAHIMLSMRPMNQNGKWESKKQKEYLCRRGDETRKFTASEFSIACKDGWEKQYRYEIGKDKIWLTPSEAEAKGLIVEDRISPNARASKLGRLNEKTAFWNSKERVREWRQAWENAVNQKFQELGIKQRVDCRSNAERGLEELATEHLGPEAMNIERRADRFRRSGFSETNVECSSAGDINREIRQYNDSIEDRNKIEKAVDQQIKNTAGKLEHHRGQMIKNNITAKAIDTAQRAVNEKTDTLQTTMDTFHMVTTANEKALAAIEVLTTLLESCGRFQISRKKELQQQIDEERQGIADRNSYLQSVMRQNNFPDNSDIIVSKSEINTLKKELSQLYQKNAAIKEEFNSSTFRYIEEIKHIPDSYCNRIQNARANVRSHTESALRRELSENGTIDSIQLRKAETQTDRLLDRSQKTLSQKSINLTPKKEHRR